MTNPATFCQQKFCILNQIKMMLNKPSRSLLTTGFFIACAQKNNVAFETDAVPFEQGHSQKLNDCRALAVNRSTAVDLSVLDRA